MNFVKKPAKSGMPASENSAIDSDSARNGAVSASPEKSAISSLPVRLKTAITTKKAARLVTA